MNALGLVSAFCLTLLTSTARAQTFDLTPAPDLAGQIATARRSLTDDLDLVRRMKTDPALRAYYTQVQNQLLHASLSFEMRDRSYVHDFVLAGPAPREPAELALRRAREFHDVVTAPGVVAEALPDQAARMKDLLAREAAWIKALADEPLAHFERLHRRLTEGGLRAPFPELEPAVEYLDTYLRANAPLIRVSNENAVIGNFRRLALTDLAGARASRFAYLTSVEAIQRTLEFLDVYHRTVDPARSPRLYHSARYDYYGHFLKGEAPEHIIIPTICSLGATDIIKVRGVPIGLVGINTEITWVDGFYQTPYEFWVHDINHGRRMWQFFKETAARRGQTILEFARASDELVRKKILPLIAIRRGDDDDVRNKKRLLKVLLFEILHEDALAADVDVITNAILRPPNLITPFEELRGTHVTYVMEPGATTLAYTFRKLAHDFYDMPGERLDNIVGEAYRTRAHIVEVALKLARAMGTALDRELLEFFVGTDIGFPSDFKRTIEKDIAARPGETVALGEGRDSQLDAVSLVAAAFHAKWQATTAHVERWKMARPARRDGRGINDGRFVATAAELTSYLDEIAVPAELRRYYHLATEGGVPILLEDIQHLPNRYLAPNNQFENVDGAAIAVGLVRRIGLRRLRFRAVDQAMTWLRAAAEEQNREWLRRNRHWAAGDAEYDRPWAELRANLQLNGLNLFQTALEIETRLNPKVVAAPQRVLLEEALRRLTLEINARASGEVRALLTGARIHAEWQRRSGYRTRFKPVAARLDDGSRVDSEAQLARYLRERSVPGALHRHYRVRTEEGAVIFEEDLQNLPNHYLGPNHREENERAAELSTATVDRLWTNQIKFKSEASAERWLRAAAQAIHAGVLARNINGSQNDPAYDVAWSKLPPKNQIHDLASVKSALETRLESFPDGMPPEQKAYLSGALARLTAQLRNARDCDAGLSRVAPASE